MKTFFGRAGGAFVPCFLNDFQFITMTADAILKLAPCEGKVRVVPLYVEQYSWLKR